MKKRIFSVLLAGLLLLACTGCGNTAPAPTEPPAPTQSAEEAEVLKVLALGNSHSNDAMQLLYQVFQTENPDKKIVLGNLYYSGCTLAEHVQFLKTDQRAYHYYKNTDGTWQDVPEASMKMALQDEQWDIITLQQVSTQAGLPKSFEGDNITTILDYADSIVKTPHQFYWNMTWAAPTDEAFYSAEFVPQPPGSFRDIYQTNYGFNTVNQHTKNVEMVQKHIQTNERFSHIIPSGTGIIYASHGLNTPQTELYRDYSHLSDFGRLLVAYTWYVQLTGEPITAVNVNTVAANMRHRRAVALGDMTVTEEMKQIIIASANKALEEPLYIPAQQLFSDKLRAHCKMNAMRPFLIM